MARLLPFLILLSCAACATHAPMSEMVMFNKSLQADTLDNQEQVGVTIFDAKPDLDRFKQEDQDARFYNENYNLPDFSFHGARLYNDKVGVSASVGTSVGIDGTFKLIKNVYGTASLSVMDNRDKTGSFFFSREFKAPELRNYELVIQAPVLVTSGLGLSIGGFYQMDTKVWRKRYQQCEGCLLWRTEYGTLSFRSYGLKSRILFQSKLKSRLLLTGHVKIGRLINHEEFYISTGLTFTPLIRSYLK